jgi:hypothetical protein
MDKIYWRIKEESKDFYSCINRINERLDHIESMINKHAVGVQNVYDEIIKVINFIIF